MTNEQLLARHEDAGPGRFGGLPPDPPTPDTVLRYIKCFNMLMRRAFGGRDLPEDGFRDRVELVLWFIETQETRVRPSTWRFQKAALLHVLENEFREDSEEAFFLLAKHTRAPGKPPISAIRSKRKQLPGDDLGHLITEIQNSPSRYKGLTLRWLSQSLALGLRPVEVGTTREEVTPAGQVFIVVKNAKATQGRGLGPERRLGLSEFTQADQVRLRRFFAEMRDHHANGTFQKVYDNCRKLLQQACLRLWPRRRTTYSLYSGRHQFSANAKARGDLSHGAALMGHKSDRTQVQNYGKRRHGVMMPLPTVDTDAVRDVRRTYGDRPRKGLKFER